MSEHVLELAAGDRHDEALLPALRDFVASSPPGDSQLVVVAHTATGRRTLRFGGLIADPDPDALAAIVAEHRLEQENRGERDGSAGRSDD